MANEKKSEAKAAAPKEAPAKDKTASGAEASKAGDTAKDTGGGDAKDTGGSAPKNYSRGEGQKPVTQAYKDNWDAIFAKKKKSR